MTQTTITLPQWYDLHVHLRQDALLRPLVAAQLAMGCTGVLAMPNTKPPVAKVFKSDDLPYRSIESYLEDINLAGGDAFSDIIVPLYLTKDTTPEMIEAGAKSGILRAAKYYPPHGTTGAEFGFAFENFLTNGVFAAIRDNNVVLCVHGEEHGMSGAEYFARNSNAEEYFYTERVPRIFDRYSDIKLIGEHVTTKRAVDTILSAGDNVAATITPQHLLYTIGDMLAGLKYHLYCLPLLKFADDRAALRRAATNPRNSKFFAGTDSAPHTHKATACGCAAGCFTGGIAPQLYAEAFEESGLDLNTAPAQKIFENFLCRIGPKFYGLAAAQKTFQLTRQEQMVQALQTPDGVVTPLPLGMGRDRLSWTITIPNP